MSCWINKDAKPTSNFQPIRLLDPDCCYEFTYLIANSADPDQQASSEANWFGSTLFAKAGYIGFSRTRVNMIILLQVVWHTTILTLNSATHWLSPHHTSYICRSPFCCLQPMYQVLNEWQTVKILIWCCVNWGVWSGSTLSAWARLSQYLGFLWYFTTGDTSICQISWLFPYKVNYLRGSNILLLQPLYNECNITIVASGTCIIFWQHAQFNL